MTVVNNGKEDACRAVENRDKVKTAEAKEGTKERVRRKQ